MTRAPILVVGVAILQVSVACNGADPSASGDTLVLPPRIANLPVQTINDGSFRELSISQSKRDVIHALYRMNARQVHPQPVRRLIATTPEDIALLSSANVIVLVPGDVRIHLQGDTVIESFVSPLIADEWGPIVKAARTREEALATFRQLLSRKVLSAQVMAIGDDRAIPVRASDATAEEQSLMDKYDRWDVTLKTERGYDFLSLIFRDAKLRTMFVQHSDTELP